MLFMFKKLFIAKDDILKCGWSPNIFGIFPILTPLDNENHTWKKREG